jgi:hypothetical protein
MLLLAFMLMSVSFYCAMRISYELSVELVLFYIKQMGCVYCCLIFNCNMPQ